MFEEGDALETVERYDGPFDLVLIDNENHRYVDAFEAVREKVATGGIVIADNVITATGQFDPEELRAVLEDDHEPETENLAGITDYYRHVRTDPAFETVLVPLGEGITVSVRL